jgi:hypothetical protein
MFRRRSLRRDQPMAARVTLQIVRVAPPNSLIFVMDDRVGVIPEDTGDAPIVATASCVVVGTLMELDGETEVRMSGPEDFTQQAELKLRWSGLIATAGVLEVSTAHAQILLSTPVHEPQSLTVDVWTNDDNEPDLVWIVVTKCQQGKNRPSKKNGMLSRSLSPCSRFTPPSPRDRERSVIARRGGAEGDARRE